MSPMTSDTRAWEADANLLRDVSHPVRLCVLDVLREAGLVVAETDGPRRLYHLRCPAFVEALLAALAQTREGSEG